MNRSAAAGSARVAVRRYGRAEDDTDEVAVEEPLLISLQWPGGAKAISVTMRTPGADAELACGFLFGEGLLTGADSVAVHSMLDGVDGAAVTVEIGAQPDPKRLQQERNFYMTSSCGVCGKAALEAVRTGSEFDIVQNDWELPAAAIQGLPKRLLEAQALFAGTGSIHAAGFFTARGELVSVYEDVGRHNAVDKLVGATLLAGNLPAADRGILVSGRASFELVQKAAMAGCPLLVAVGAPSSLAVDLAWEAGMTLVGFVREDRFNVYSVPARIRDLS